MPRGCLPLATKDYHNWDQISITTQRRDDLKSCPNTRPAASKPTLYDAREPYDFTRGAYRGDNFLHFLQRRRRSRSHFQETLASYWRKSHPICRSTAFLEGYEEVYPVSSGELSKGFSHPRIPSRGVHAAM
jgi:hypothetical protein